MGVRKMLKYKYKETKEIRKLLNEIEAYKIVFKTITPLPNIEENIRRESLLKSSLFSARIEGNPLTLERARFLSQSRSEKDISKLEVFNLLKAYKQIRSKQFPKKLSNTLIKRLHKIVMKGISASSGKFRTEPWAIYNQAGAVVYLAPAHFKVFQLINELIIFYKKTKYEPPVNAAMIQFLFEKIHPFADGNGRVGRLLSTHILVNNDFGFRGLISFEEHIDQNRSLYYQALEPSTDATEFVEFFLNSLVIKAKEAVKKLTKVDKELPEDGLLPRRREILEIVREHPYCSFNFISRRFVMVNPKTLHYDLKKLREAGFITKAGITRGSLYKVKVATN